MTNSTINGKPAPEVMDDSKYAKGTGLFSVYENVEFASDPVKRCKALMELGTEPCSTTISISLISCPSPRWAKWGKKTS